MRVSRVHLSVCLSVPLPPVLWSALRVCPAPFGPSPRDAEQSGAASCYDGHSSLPVGVGREGREGGEGGEGEEGGEVGRYVGVSSSARQMTL